MNHCAGLASASLRKFTMGLCGLASLCVQSSRCDLEIRTLLLQLAVVHVNCEKLRMQTTLKHFTFFLFSLLQNYFISKYDLLNLLDK